MTQGTLFDANPGYRPPQAQRVAPQPPAIDPVAVEAKRLSRQCQAILERLRSGRASNSELAEMALNYRARISDLRQRGFRIKVTDRNHETGLSWYELER